MVQLHFYGAITLLRRYYTPTALRDYCTKQRGSWFLWNHVYSTDNKNCWQAVILFLYIGHRLLGGAQSSRYS
jgi:hypothetical protein